MGVSERLALYEKMEQLRGRPLIVYVTTSRPGVSGGHIAGDVLPELHDQLQALPENSKEIDLLLVSNGGDPTVAWRIVSLIRERAQKLAVLVPQAAFSAATLIALGADEIVMHANGNLGPTDVQIHAPRKNANGTTDSLAFGSEDLSAFLKYAKESVGISDQSHMRDVFLKFCEEVGTVAVGVAARSSQLGLLMGEKLLQLHMNEDGNQQQARAISEKLTRDYFHHGYPVSRSEAREIGLKVADPGAEVESLMWEIWTDVSKELELRSQYSPLIQLMNDEKCKHLRFPIVDPNGKETGSTRYRNIVAIMESKRVVSHFITAGEIGAVKTAPHSIQLQVLPDEHRWNTVWPVLTPNHVAGNSDVIPTVAKKVKKAGKVAKPKQK